MRILVALLIGIVIGVFLGKGCTSNSSSNSNLKVEQEFQSFEETRAKKSASGPTFIEKREAQKVRGKKTGIGAKEEIPSGLRSVERSEKNKHKYTIKRQEGKKEYKYHPGHVRELDPGTKLPNGMIVGQEEASLYLSYFEQPLYEKLEDLSQKELEEKFAEELHWFQRVGNFRKRQKCQSIQKMQKEFGLPQTNFDKCVADILETEKVEWGDQ